MPVDRASEFGTLYWYTFSIPIGIGVPKPAQIMAESEGFEPSIGY